jgi:hypothetical protein
MSRHKLDAKLHCRSIFGSCCEVHVDPDITNTLDPRAKWAICMGLTGNLQGGYKFLSLATGKKVTQRKFTEMPITELVIKQVEEMAVKDGAGIVVNFKDRKGFEYEFDNNEEYELMVEPDEPAPIPDIPAEAPGMLTELKEAYGVDEVVQDEPEQSDEQQAMLAAENLGIDFSSIPTKVSGGEVIEILDDDEEDAIDKYEQEEVLVKMEPDREAERAEAGAPDKEGAMFVQSDGGDNSWKSRLTCYRKCGKQGHIAQECPKKEEKQDQMHATIKKKQDASEEDPDNGENIFVQKKEGGVVNKNWVLLDSQSTVNQVSNFKHQKCEEPLHHPLQRRIYQQHTRRRIWECDGKAQPPWDCKHAFTKQSKATSQGDVWQPRSRWGFPSAH